MSVRQPGRITVGVVLFTAGAGWTGGNVGPAVTQVSRAFDVSLSKVRFLMTVFFAAIALVTVFAPPLANHIGVGRTVVLACAPGIGNAVFAASPLFSGLLLGRVLVGLGAGFAFVVGPMVARASGALRLLGLFWGSGNPRYRARSRDRGRACSLRP